MIDRIKRAIWYVYCWWPYGNFAVIDSRGDTIRLTKQLWVITSDGISSDALPMNFVSEKLIERFVYEMHQKWFFPDSLKVPKNDL